MRWALVILLVALAPAGFGKTKEKEELPPLPVWDPADEDLVQRGQIVPGMDLFREDVDESELPVPPPIVQPLETLTPAIEPIAEEEEDPTQVHQRYHETYFGRRPASYLMDPQQLLSRQEYRDRESFLEYHAGDSEISLYIYLFDSEQQLPEGMTMEGVLQDHFGGSGPTALVFYHLGVPERSTMALSGDIRSIISADEQKRALKTSIQEAFEKSEEADQLDNFSVELSIRLYWFEKAMSGPVMVPIGSGNKVINLEPGSSRPAARAKRPNPVSVANLAWVIGIVLGAALLGFVGRLIARRQGRYVFPEVETATLLGAPHAAGVGAVISFSSAQVPPSQQRDQVPDYLQRM